MSYALILPQIIVLIVSIVAIVWALVELLLNLRGDSFIVAVNAFWALYNSGLAIAIIQFDYKKLFQFRSRFRIPDVVPVFYQLTKTDNSKKRLAVADNITEDGLSLVVIGQIPMDREMIIDLMLPKTTINLNCLIAQEKTITAGQYPVSHIGLRFKDTSQDARDVLSRYLSASAVTKFMKEYSIGSKTYIERRFMAKSYFRERAYRALAYLPVNVSDGSGEQTFAVIKDISKSGLMLSTRTSFSTGSEIMMDVILGGQKINFKGLVVRNIAHESIDYPEYMLGVQFDETFYDKVPYLLGISDKIGAFMLG